MIVVLLILNITGQSMIRIIKNIIYMTKLTFNFAKGQYFIGILLFTFNTFTPFINIYFPKWIIDELTTQKRWDQIVFMIILWACINAVIAIINAIINIFSNSYRDRCNLRESMHYLNIDADMDYSMLEDGATLDEQGRIGSNISLSYFSNTVFFDLISNVVQLIGYTYIIATLNPFLLAFILVVILLNYLLSKRIHTIDFAYQKQISKFKRRFEYLFKVLISYQFAKEIRINNASDWVTNKYESEIGCYIECFKNNENRKLFYYILSDAVLFFQTLVIYIYSAIKTIKGAVTLGDFTLFVNSSTLFISSFTSLVVKINKLKFISDYIDAYKQFLEKSASTISSNEKYNISNLSFETNKHEIEFVNVSFKYPGCENYVLKNISVKIKSGERLSIVGYNGAGKTTFIKLICRLYKPTTGKILYNGIDISEINYEQYVRSLSIVFQDFNIYSFSVKDNICLAGNIDDEKVNRAIKLSGLSERLIRLPLGFETQIGKEFDENGIEFSGGEQQKIATARAYYKNAPIVILDEPTASLDPIAENNLYERFNLIIGDKTAIYISHRLASVKFCDKIIVFVNGKVVETGTHDELIKNNGFYKEMFAKQAEYYVDSNANNEV